MKSHTAIKKQELNGSSPYRRDTIVVIDSMMDQYQELKEQSENVLQSDLQSQEENFKKRLE
jgi:translation initiation factor 2B subunit (eIF-2B alpha/beta/delta family)